MEPDEPPGSLTFIAPVGVTLPHVSACSKGARFLRTAGALGGALAPATARRLLSRSGTESETPRAVRLAFERLGATYVKFGQFVGSAPDLVGERTANEFRSCLDTGPAVPFAEVRAIVESETGQPLNKTFSTFDPVPLAAASLAVVHRASLPTGEHVAVKVLRPGMERLVAADLAVMQAPARFLARQGSDVAMDILGYLLGLEEQVAEELDLRNEARSMEYFRARFAELGLSLLAVPRVHPALSGRRVLTMELFDSVPIDDLAQIERLGADPKPVVRQLMQAWVLTALFDGTFHGDIHAGNLLLLRDGRLGMVDWGIVARLDPDTHRMVRCLLEAALGVESAWQELTTHYIRMQGASLRDGLGLSDEQVYRLVRGMMEPVLTQPVRDVSMASLFSTSEASIELATGERIKQRSLSEKWRLLQRKRRRNRMKIASGAEESGFERASFLAAKQVIYLERYWKMYLPDEAILGDKEFLARVLSQSAVDEQLAPA